MSIVDVVICRISMYFLIKKILTREIIHLGRDMKKRLGTNVVEGEMTGRNKGDRRRSNGRGLFNKLPYVAFFLS